MVLRLLPLSGGRLTLGGVPLTDLSPADLPSYVAGSLQGDHIFIFDTTLRDNLRVARPDADDGRLDEAAEIAGCATLLAELPARWDTVLGPDGSFLSGGPCWTSATDSSSHKQPAALADGPSGPPVT